MPKYITCVPSLNDIQKQQINEYLKEVKQLKVKPSKDVLINQVLSIVLDSNPDVIVDYNIDETGKYENLPEELQTIVTEIATSLKVFGVRLSHVNYAIQNLAIPVKDTTTYVEPIITESITVAEDNDTSNNEFDDDTDNETISELQKELSEITINPIKFLKGELNFADICSHYFPIDRNLNEFQDEFRSFFINSYFENIYGFDGDKYYFNTPEESKKQFERYIKKVANSNRNVRLAGNDLSNFREYSNINDRNAFYAYLSDTYLNGLAQELIPGLGKLTKKGVSFNAGDIAISNYNSFDKFALAFLNNTPLLQSEVVNGKLVFSSRMKPDGLSTVTISNNDLNLVFDYLIQLDQNSEQEYNTEFRELLEKTTGQTRDILASLYNKYFSEEEYIVDGESNFSLKMLVDNIEEEDTLAKFNSKDLLASIKSGVTSSRTKNYTSTSSNNTQFSNLFLSGASSQVIENFRLGLVSGHIVNGKEKLSTSVLNSIEFRTTEDNEPILAIKIDRTEYKIGISLGDLKPMDKLYMKAANVQINPRDQKILLRHLLGQNNMISRDNRLFEALRRLTSDSTNALHSSYNFNDLIVNIAWVLKSFDKNNEASLAEFSDSFMSSIRNVTYDTSLENLSDTLFKALDTGFDRENKGSKILSQLLTTATEQSISLSAPQTVLNWNRDKVATTTNVTKQDLHKMYISQVNKAIKRESLQEAPKKVLLRNNIFVGNKAKLTILKPYTMNGSQLYDKVKTFKEMSPLEGNIYLIENIFLESLAQNKGESAAFLTTIHADKSSHDAQMFGKTLNGYDFMPVNSEGKLDTKSLMRELISSRKNYHNDLGEQIVNKWITYLQTKGIDTSSISDITSLNGLLNELKLPVSDVKFGNSGLVSEVEFTTVETRDLEGNLVKHAGINPLFVYQFQVWNNPSLAKDYVNQKFSQFKNNLKKSRYINDKGERHSFASLSPSVESFLKERFNKVNASDIYTSYFFNKLIIGDEFNNITGSLFYQSLNGLTSASTKETIEKEVETISEHILTKKKTKGDTTGITESEMHLIRMRAMMSIADQVMYSDFIKRAGPQASTGHKIGLKGKNEKGLNFEEFSFNAVIDDHKARVELLGSLINSNSSDFKVYDAYTIGYPLFRNKVNNGIGSTDIHATYKGAFKTLNNSKDIYSGYGILQKNIVVPLTYEQISNSAALQNLFIKMGSAVSFSEYGLQPVNIEGTICNNVHEMFMALGGFVKFDEAMEKLGDILADNTEYRAMYIETVAMESGQKRGVSNMNRTDVLFDKNVPLLYQKIPVTHLVTILNLEHNPDTTASLNSDDDGSRVSALTQAFSAASNEIATPGLSKLLIDALGKVSKNELDLINRQTINDAVDLLDKQYSKIGEGVDPKEREEVFGLIALHRTNYNFKSEKLDSYIEKNNLINKARKNFVAELAKEALKTSSVKGPGDQLLAQEDVTFESLQLDGVAYTALSSYIEKLVVRVKFAGGQQVVAPAHDFFTLYTSKNGNKLNRSSYNKVADKVIPITLENIDQYLDTDLVLVNNQTEPVLFGSVRNTVGTSKILGVDFSQKETNLEMMKYYRLKEDGSKQYVSDLEQYKLLKNEHDQSRRTVLEQIIQSILNSGEWTSVPTEFFGPALHAAAFNLEDADLIIDITGDLDINDKTTIDQVIENSSEFFNNRLREMSSDIRKLNKLVSENKNPTAAVLKLFNQKISNSWVRNDFTKKVNIDNLMTILKKDLKNIQDPLVDEFISQVYSKLRETEQQLIDAKLDSNDILFYKVPLDEISILGRTLSNAFIEKLSKEQGKDFYRTLTFFTGRIPGQAKQSATVGQMKGFMNSTANTMYSSSAFSQLTGQDHDGDKLNTIAYAVDSFGRIYDYSFYLDANGNISNEIINQRNQSIIDRVLSTRETIESTLRAKSNMSGKSDIEINKIVDKIIQEKTKAALEVEENYFSNAAKNKVLDTLIAIWSDPKNAIESQRPISMDELNKSLSKKISVISSLDENDNEENVPLAERISKDDPSADTIMKDVLLGGKDVVGIEANFLKVNGAWTMGYVMDKDSEGLKFNINDYLSEHFNIKSDDSTDEVVIYNYDENNNLVRKSSKRLADTNSLSSQDLNSDIIKNLIKNYKESKFYKDLIESDAYKTLLQDVSEEVIINTILTDSLVDKSLSRVRANEYISQLLSAATDNAKEFILGQIGADKVTSGIISSGILLGFNLSDMMAIVNDPKVKEVLEEVRNSQTIYNRGFSTALKKAVIKKLKYSKNLSQLNDDSDKIISNLETQREVLSSLKSSQQYKAEGVLENPNNVLGELSYNLDAKDTVVPENILNAFVEQYKGVVDDRLKNILNAFSLADTIFISDKDAANSSKQLKLLATKLNKHIIFLDGINNFSFNNSEKTPIIKGNYINATGRSIDKLLLDAKSNNKHIYEINSNDINVYDLNKVTELDLIEAKIESEQKYKLNNKNEILNDKVRQLAIFLDIKSQLSELSSVLNINQGLHSNMGDTLVYLTKVSTALGTPIRQLPKLLEDLENNKIEITTTKLPVSSVFNIHFILQSNPQFIQYLKGELLKYSTFNDLSTIHESIHTITTGISPDLVEELEGLSKEIAEDGDNAKEASLIRFNEINDMLNSPRFNVSNLDQIKEVKQFVYDYSIDTHYNTNESQLNFNLNIENDNTTLNTNYDLSLSEDRERMINDLPMVINKLLSDVPDLSDNPFFDQIKPDAVYDTITKKKSVFLKPLVRLTSLDPSKHSILANSFQALGKHKNPDVRKLYEALNHYALIVYAGGRSANSFASLTDNVNNDLWVSYAKTLRNLDVEKLTLELNNVRKYKDLLVPSTIKVLSTEEYNTINSDYEGEEQDFPSFKYKKLRYTRMPKENPKGTYVPPDVFHSKELRETFVRIIGIDGEKVYVPITMKYAKRAINFSLSNIGDIFDKLGYNLGKPAMIGKDEPGHILYFKNNKYVAKNQYGKLVWIEDINTLQSLNPNMKFDKELFGERRITEYGEKQNEFILNFNKNMIEDLTSSLNFRIVKNIDDDVRPGTVLLSNQAGNFQGENIIYSIVYENEYTADQIKKKKIVANFSIKDQIAIKNDKDNKEKYKVVKIVLHSTPAVINESFSKIKASPFNYKVIKMESSYLVSERKDLSDVIRLSTTGSENEFSTFRKETSGAEAVALEEFIKNSADAKKDLSFTDKDFDKVKKSMLGTNGKRYFVHKVIPMDVRGSIFNSLQEMNLLESQEIESNLDELTVYAESALDKDLISKFGASFKLLNETVEHDASLLLKIKSALGEEFSSLLDSFSKTISNKEVNTVIIFTDLYNEHFMKLSKEAKKVFFNDEKILPGISTVKFENIQKEIADYKKLLTDKEKFSSRTHKNYIKAATASGKNIFVYDTYSNQWKAKVDSSWVDCKIPAVTSGGLVTINSAGIQDKKYLETIFKASSKQNNLNEDSLEEEYLVSEFDFDSVESDAELNKPSAIWNTEEETSLKNISALSDENISVYDNEKIESSEIKGKKVYTINGKPIDEFFEFENATVKLMPDDCIIFTTKSKGVEKNYVYIPEERASEYADFRGDSVFNNFRFSVPSRGLYFDISKMHYVKNMKAFEIRNKMIVEKTALKKLYNAAREFRLNEINRKYLDLRFPKNASSSRMNMFSGVRGQRAFVNAVQLDYFYDKFTPEEKILANDLVAKYKDYSDLIWKAREERKNIVKQYTSKLKLKSNNSIFDESNNNHVLVIPTLKGSTDSSLRPEFTKRYIVTAKSGENGRNFVLPVFKSDDGKLISNQANDILFHLKNLVKLAEENPNKTYFFELPGNNLTSEIVPNTGLTNKNAAVALAKTFNQAKNVITEWPSNVIMPEILINFINTNDGWTNTSAINRTKPFITVKAHENENAYKFNNDRFLDLQIDSQNSDMTVREVWANWKGIISNPDTMYALPSADSFSRQTFGSDEEAFTQLVRYWSTNNPKLFNKMSAEVGNSPIANFNINERFSFATAFAKVLNEKYIYNTAINLSVQEKPELLINDGQSMVALMQNDVKFDENGEALVKDAEGELYKLKVINAKHSPIALNNLDIQLARALVEEPDFIYNKSKEKNFSFVLATVNRFNSVVKTKYEYSEGQLFDELSKAEISLTKEQEDNSKEATHILPIDVNANLSQTVDERYLGTERITSIVAAINENINVNYTKDSQIMLIGNTLSDPIYDMQKIQNVIGLYSSIIDRGIEVRATFLIDNETGVTDQLKSYILNNENYRQEGNKLVFNGSINRITTAKRLFVKTEINSRILNKNNDFNRGQSISGMVQMSSTSKQGYKPYNITNVSDEEILDWSSSIDIKDLFSTIPTSETNFDHERVINLSVEKQKTIMSYLIQLHILHKNGIDIKGNMLSLIVSNEVLNEQYREVYDKVFEFFNNTRLKISVRSNNIRNNYIQEHFPELVENTNEVYFSKLSNINVLDTNEIQNEILKTPLTVEFINEVASKANSVEDAFHLLTSTNGYLFTKGKLEGQKAAVLLSKYLSNIKAFKTNSGLLILNHYNVTANNPGKNYDGTSFNEIKESKIYNNIEKYISEKVADLHAYLKKFNLMILSQTDNNTIYFDLSDSLDSFEELHISKETSAEEFSKILDSKIGKIKSTLYDRLTTLHDDNIISYGDNLSVAYGTDMLKGSNSLLASYIHDKKSLNMNPWLYKFKKISKISIDGLLDPKTLKANKLYNFKDGVTEFDFIPVKLSNAYMTLLVKEKGSDKIKITALRSKDIINILDVVKEENFVGEINTKVDFNLTLVDRPISGNLKNLGKTFTQIIINDKKQRGNFRLTYDGLVQNVDEEGKVLNYFEPDNIVGINLPKWKEITVEKFNDLRYKQPEIFKKGDDLDNFCSIS